MDFSALIWICVLSLALVKCATINSNAIEADCQLPQPRNSFFAPLIFTRNGVLKSSETNSITNEDYVRLLAGETVIVSCAPNRFKFNPVESFEATCKTGQILLVNGQEMNFRKTLGCDLRVIEEVLAPVRGCDLNAALISSEFGFTNPVNNVSYILGEVCYDERLGRTNFVHITYKAGYKNYELENVAMRQGDENHFKQVHPDSRYKMEFLRAASDSIGSSPLVQHLYVGDELLLNHQMYTLKKLGWNYVMVNGELVVVGMLKAIEDAQAKLAFEGVADIYMGSHGVLRVLDKNGENTEVYLKDGRFPVAKFFWMVVVTPSNRAIAYVIPNGVGQGADEVCANECVGSAVHCCQYGFLKAQVSEVPILDHTLPLLTV